MSPLEAPRPAATAPDPDFPVPSPRAADRGRTATWLIAAAAFQVAVLAWMIFGTAMMFRGAETVRVRVEPVDPRDLFRGQFVTLSYPFSRVPAGGVEGIPGPYTIDNTAEWQGRPVFVPLIPEEGSPGRYRGGPPTATPPARGSLYLQGTLESPTEIDFGIESFYVQEGEGKAYEDAVREHKLWAEIAVTRYGWGTVKSLSIE